MTRTPTTGQANSASKVLAASQFQINWQTATITIAAEIIGGSPTYPTLYPSTLGQPITFQQESILFGVSLSGSWFTAAAAENAAVVVAPYSSTPISAYGFNGAFFSTMIACRAGTTANQLIQRTPGFIFSPPLMRYIPPSTTIQFFGSKQHAMDYEWNATLYFLPFPDYLALMTAANA